MKANPISASPVARRDRRAGAEVARVAAATSIFLAVLLVSL
jgi:hypothetical protein